jgi:hypothetical protein
MVAGVRCLVGGCGGCGLDRSRSILVRRVISRSAMAHWAQFRRPEPARLPAISLPKH